MGARVTLDLPCQLSTANAVRRTLASDLESWAPVFIDVRKNLSCQTDEFLAHRIGMIPFRRVGNGDSMSLDVNDEGWVTCGKVHGVAFEPVYPDIPVILLGKNQRLDLTIHFDRRPSASHARYTFVSAIGMRPLDQERHQVRFEVNDPRIDLNELKKEALDALERRIDDALGQLSSQPECPPRSLA